MGSVETIEDDPAFDVDETIFVAVGEDVEASKTKLSWAVENFAGKKICVLHVHQPAHAASPAYKRSYNGRFNQKSPWAFRQGQRQNVDELLTQYLQLLYESGVRYGRIIWAKLIDARTNLQVQAEKLCTFTDNIEKGIVDLIIKHRIKWLVMGAASDKHYSRKMTGLKSKKAIYVSHEALISCHIWFICKGCLTYTRRATEDRDEIDKLHPPILPDSNRIQLTEFQPASVTVIARPIELTDAEEDSEETEGALYGSASQSAQSFNSSISEVISDDKLTPLSDEEGEYQGPTHIRINHKDVRTNTDARNSKKIIVEEALKRWKDEDIAMEARCEAKALECLCIKEMSNRKELEAFLEKERQEKEKMKDLHDSAKEELQRVRSETWLLENRLAESQKSVKVLEEKIISAVGLLQSFRKQRDEMRIEHEKTKNAIKELEKSVAVDADGSCGAQILEFSFKEINEATNEFDQAWKIGEGNYGSVYKGLLHHVRVAIKMLPSYGSQSLSEFQSKVEILSRVRHPNLATLIGTCPESRSLVFEYLSNGSLEDHLSSNNSNISLSWETRVRITSEICSALLFLHCNEPSIIHGNFKAAKVLLDSNFFSKIIDYGVFQLVPQEENATNSVTSVEESNRASPESDVHSFGIVLLQLLTRIPVPRILRDVKCALENDNFEAVLDHSAGDWPVARAKRVAHLALQCCDKSYLVRPSLSEILRALEPMKSSSITSSLSHSGSMVQKRVPSHFLCPVFQEVMKNPLIAADGFTYEADAIRGWLESGHDTSPMTNLKLDHCNLLPNHALFQAIQQWQR